VPGIEDLEDLTALRELRSLTIQVRVTDAKTGVLRSFPNLRSLGGVDFDTAAESRLGELKQLNTLSLYLGDRPGTERSLLAAMKTLPALENLTLGGTITEEWLAGLQGLKKLRRLDLSFIRGGFTRAEVATLMRSLPQLEQLKVSIVSGSTVSHKERTGDPFE
jgi:hypothetical protein